MLLITLQQIIYVVSTNINNNTNTNIITNHPSTDHRCGNHQYQRQYKYPFQLLFNRSYMWQGPISIPIPLLITLQKIIDLTRANIDNNTDTN